MRFEKRHIWRLYLI